MNADRLRGLGVASANKLNTVHSTSQLTVGKAATPRSVATTPRAGSNRAGKERPARLSGEKRSEREQEADQPAAKKKKVTYLLPNQNMDEGQFYVVLGEDVDVSSKRFKMLSLLGEGTFGKVVEAWDRTKKAYCAVKVVRNVPKYTRDAKYEIQYMERVKQCDTADNYMIMKIQEEFMNDSKHQCIVMPKYGPCLLRHLEKYGGFPHHVAADIIFQAAVTLDWMHSSLRMMHTDLKPENILLESKEVVTSGGQTLPAQPCKIRLCDLGGCCTERHSKTAIVSTRHYRSPEVVLGLGWMFSTDVWSLGCILYELVTGKLLFGCRDNLNHLHMLERVLGPLPSEWSRTCMPETKSLFTPTGRVAPVTDPKSLERLERYAPLHEKVHDADLLSLLRGMLHYDRKKRFTCRQVANHPYILKYYPESARHPQHPNNSALPPVPTEF